jgi:hypothetical protein
MMPLLLVAVAALLLARGPQPAGAATAAPAAHERTLAAEALRTLAAPHDAAGFGGVIYFTLPFQAEASGAAPACPPSVLHAFAKCLALPGGGQRWRLAAAFASTRFRASTSPPEGLSQFGPPGGCPLPPASLQPLPAQALDDEASQAAPPPARRLPMPLPLVEPGMEG